MNPLTAIDGAFSMHEAKRELDELLRLLVEMGGSDLHLTAGIAPCFRINGALKPLEGRDRLLPVDTETLVRSILSDAQWQRFDASQELDTAYALPGVSRFRVNVYRQRGAVGAVMRAIPHKIRGLEELGMPQSVESFAHLPRGLVLVTGPTGSGKSTTLAALLDVANRSRSAHIVTIEDPIEYLHSHGRSVVNQREVGSDTADFAVALKHVLRQDPDIILVGELRDLETTSVAVTAAETGHLVLATLHTQSAAQTVDRMIDIYPPHQQQQIRAQLANCLQGVVTQALVPRKDGMGRSVVCEVMVATSAIRNLIREGKVHQIGSFLQSSSDVGMISFDQHLAQRYGEQLISKTTALELAHDPNEFKRLARISAMATKTYAYEAIDGSGALLKGTIESDSPEAAANSLAEQKLVPLSVAGTGQGMRKEIKIPGIGGRTGLKDLAILSRQFASMTASGLTMIRALSILEDQATKPKLRQALAQIRSDVQGGTPLSTAMSQHPDHFPMLMVNMIKAGETGGFLDEALARIARMYEADANLRAKIKSAMTYPVIVLIFSLLLGTGVIIFIVPVFEKMFKQLNGKLPLPTQIMVNLSHNMYWVLPVVIVGAILGLRLYRRAVRRNYMFRLRVDKTKLKLPVFGSLFTKLAISRWARNLGTLLSVGVPIIQALDIVGGTAGNAVVSEAMIEVRDAVRVGSQMSGPLSKNPLFPNMVVQMLEVGEETGQITDMLDKVSDFYDREVETATDSLTSAMEPLLVVLLGAVIGVMVICLYMPMFSIYQHIQSN